MGHSGLTDRVARGNVTSADGAELRELAKDAQPKRVGDGLQQTRIGSRKLFHPTILRVILINVYIDRNRYMGQSGLRRNQQETLK